MYYDGNPLEDVKLFERNLLTYIHLEKHDPEFLKDISATRGFARINYATEDKVVHFNKSKVRTKLQLQKQVLQYADLEYLNLSDKAHERIYLLSSRLGFLFRVDANNVLEHYFSFETIALFDEDYYFHQLFVIQHAWCRTVTSELTTNVPICRATIQTDTGVAILEKKFDLYQSVYYFTNEEANDIFSETFLQVMKSLYNSSGMGFGLKLPSDVKHPKNNGIFFLITYPTLMAFYKSPEFACFDIKKLAVNGFPYTNIDHNDFIEEYTVLMNNGRATKIRAKYDLKTNTFVSEPFTFTFQLEIATRDEFHGETLTLRLNNEHPDNRVSFQKAPDQLLYTGHVDTLRGYSLLASPFTNVSFSESAYAEFDLLGVSLRTKDFVRIHLALMTQTRWKSLFPLAFSEVLKQSYRHTHPTESTL